MAEEIGSGVFSVKGEMPGVDRMLQHLQMISSNTARQLTHMERSATRAFDGTGKAAKSMGMAVQTGFAYATFGLSAVVAGLGALTGISLKMAGDAGEVGSKFDTVFGDQADQARESLDRFAATVGRSKAELYEMASSIQDTFVPLGFSRKTAADLSDAVTKLAVDLASFNNMSDTEALEAMKSALIGNHETVRKFGVIITETTLNQKLMEMGIKGGTEAATEQQKAMARLKMIMEGTTDAHDDATKTSGSFANQSRAVWGVVKDLAVEFGSALIPSMNILMGVFKETLGWVQANTSFLEEWGQTLASWVQYGVDAIKTFVFVISNMDLVWQAMGIAIAETFYGAYDRAKWASENMWIAIKWFFSNFWEIAQKMGHNYIQLWKNVFNNFSKIWGAIWELITTGSTQGMGEVALGMMKGMEFMTSSPEFKEFKGSDFSDQWEDNFKEWERRMEGSKVKAKEAGKVVKKELNFDELMKEGGKDAKKQKIEVELVKAEETFRKNLLAQFKDREGSDTKKQTELQVKIAKSSEQTAETLVKLESKLPTTGLKVK